MKKSILNLGKALKKAEQKEVKGGLGFFHACDNVNIKSICDSREDCIWEPSPISGGYCNSRRNETIPHYDAL